MSDIFKNRAGREEMKAADDPQFAPAVMQWPGDAPWASMPDLWSKKHWPAHVENVMRPRFGRDQG
jgi:hypothetical protein